MSASLAAIFSCQCFSKLVCMKVSQPNTKRRNGNLGDLMLREFNNKEITDTIGGSKGGRQGRAPPRGSKFFHFHAVFSKNLKNNSNFGSWRTPLGKILDPPLDTETDGISWMKVAKIFDRFFLVLFTVMALVSMLIFLCFYPTNRGKDNPKDFPKEQVNWNLTDF